jgi:hypothetical protein
MLSSVILPLLTLLLVGLKPAHLQYEWPPLHLAVQTQRTDMVKLLLIKGADRTLKTQVSKVKMLTFSIVTGIRRYGLIEWLFYINHIPFIRYNHDATSVLQSCFSSVV